MHSGELNKFFSRSWLGVKRVWFTHIDTEESPVTSCWVSRHCGAGPLGGSNRIEQCWPSVPAEESPEIDAINSFPHTGSKVWRCCPKERSTEEK